MKNRQKVPRGRTNVRPKSIRGLSKVVFDELLNLMYPNLCLICGENLSRNEQFICLACVNKIPKTNFHLQENNPVEKRFWGKVHIHRATAFYFFQKGSDFQKLMHQLKYKGDKELGEELGKYAAADLLESPDFGSVDLIVPVPLHKNKLQKRGYNQSEWIARGLSAVIGKPVDTTNLYRAIENPTQTKKSVYERYENTEGIFKLNNAHIFAGKHILLVDDVLTTGSTLEACVSGIEKVHNIKVSIFTLALA